MKINVKTIQHSDQRYPTVGDWIFLNNGTILQVKVSDMSNPHYELLVAIHEIIEAFLCQARGIEEKDITNFDVVYEIRRKIGDFSEPGDDPDAPYYLQHQFATKIEKLLARELGVNWDEYDATVNSLG